ncbi:hypothetical protein NVP2275O_231 [Vibrio phage 2.275.O._10N.286.54.E11]|nr:hypothetical protein NVP2275O_231 [Vibrio phage 2.275.O._10N.286.54.E11]
MLTPHMIEHMFVETKGKFSFICFKRAENTVEKRTVRQLLSYLGISFHFIPGSYVHENLVQGADSEISSDNIKCDSCSCYQIKTEDLAHLALMGL